jgi:hypothetical protein
MTLRMGADRSRVKAAAQVTKRRKVANLLALAVLSYRDRQRPERTVDAPTDAGRRELGDWLRELVEVPQHGSPQVVPRCR